MAEATFHCSVVTPEAKVFDGETDFVVIPAHDGEIGILHNRAPLVCKLGPGRMRVRLPDGEQEWFVDAGFAQVVENKVVVLTQEAIRPDEIDREQAQSMLSEAQGMTPTDAISFRRKSQMEASARARLRLSK